MNIGTFKITNKCTDLTEITQTALSQNIEYSVQNKSNVALFICIKNTTPETNEGYSISPKQLVKFVYLEGTVFVKSGSAFEQCVINISQ